MAIASSKKFFDIQANYRVWIPSETCTWHDNNIQTWLNAKHVKLTYHSISFSGHAVFMSWFLVFTSIDMCWCYWTNPWPGKEETLVIVFNCVIGISTVLLLISSQSWHYWKLTTWNKIFTLFFSLRHI